MLGSIHHKPRGDLNKNPPPRAPEWGRSKRGSVPDERGPKRTQYNRVGGRHCVSLRVEQLRSSGGSARACLNLNQLWWRAFCSSWN